MDHLAAWPWVALAFFGQVSGVVLACSPATSHTFTTSDSSTATGAVGSAGSPGQGGLGQGGSGQGGGLGGHFGTGGFTPVPVKDLPGLASITFYERTGGTAPTPYE